MLSVCISFTQLVLNRPTIRMQVYAAKSQRVTQSFKCMWCTLTFHFIWTLLLPVFALWCHTKPLCSQCKFTIWVTWPLHRYSCVCSIFWFSSRIENEHKILHSTNWKLFLHDLHQLSMKDSRLYCAKQICPVLEHFVLFIFVCFLEKKKKKRKLQFLPVCNRSKALILLLICIFATEIYVFVLFSSLHIQPEIVIIPVVKVNTLF